MTGPRILRSGLLALALGTLLGACSSDHDSPTGPSGVGVAEGAWRGQTSQGKDMGFDVVDGEVTNIHYVFYKEVSGCQYCCQIGHSTTREFPIRGDRFEFSHSYSGTSWTVTGTFTTPTRCEGRIHDIKVDPGRGCVGHDGPFPDVSFVIERAP